MLSKVPTFSRPYYSSPTKQPKIKEIWTFNHTLHCLLALGSTVIFEWYCSLGYATDFKEETLFWIDLSLRNELAEVLFVHYEVLSILMAPSHLMPLFGLGVKDGLVLDIGYSEATLIPVYENVPILKVRNIFKLLCSRRFTNEHFTYWLLAP